LVFASGNYSMLIALLLAAILVILCVVIHYFVLEGLSALVPRMRSPKRLRMGIVILGAIMGHLAEITVFAFGIAALIFWGEHGSLQGELQAGLRDYFYYSAVTYTSLGFGDLTPFGHLRLLAAVEALTGLVLIAWTASFAYLQMQRFWGQDE
jgi:amino acid transporter